MQTKCVECNKIFDRSKSEIKRVKNTFCSVQCKRYYHQHLKNNCLFCSKVTKNPKFCSKSCAAKYNNTKFPKRQRKKYFCVDCGVEVKNRRKYCELHNPQKRDWSKITIKDMEDRSGKYANKYRSIRDHSRNIYIKSDKIKHCLNCNYDKHFDVCHIKDIQEFPKNTTIEIVNSLNNLVALCKNCHWEFDNDLLQL